MTKSWWFYHFSCFVRAGNEILILVG